MGLDLKEAVNHAKSIKKLDCKICGNIYTDLIQVVFMIRHDHYCSLCVKVGLDK